MAEIDLQREGSIAHIVLNRPQQRNAPTQTMWRVIPGLIDEVERDNGAKVAIVRGVESSAFAAGADIAEFPKIHATPEKAIVANDAVQLAQRRLWELAKPSIAMIQGACVGGGCGLALACDFRFADATARFGITPGTSWACVQSRRYASARLCGGASKSPRHSLFGSPA